MCCPLQVPQLWMAMAIQNHWIGTSAWLPASVPPLRSPHRALPAQRSTVRLRLTTSNPLSQSAINDEPDAIDTLGSEEKMVCGRMFQANCWFCGWSEAFVQSPCLRTPQPGAPPALRCWLTTDWSQVPKFDGFQSLYADEWSIYIYITVIFDQW